MKFGVREICDVVLRAKNAMKVGNKIFYKNEPVLYFDSLKTSSMESQATTVYAQGGRGNARLIAWEGERTVTFTMEDALLSPEGFSILTGAGLVKAEEKSVIIHKTEITNKVRKEDGYVEINLSEIPYIEAGKIEIISEEDTYFSIESYNRQYSKFYHLEDEEYIEITNEDIANAYLAHRIPSQTVWYQENENSEKILVTEANYNPTYLYFVSSGGSNYNPVDPTAQTAEAINYLLQQSETIYIKIKEEGIYQRANDKEDFIYVMLLDENGEVCSESYIASETALNSNTIYIYAQETGNDYIDNVQESDINITRKNDLLNFTNNCSVLVDYYVKKEKNAFQIDITPDKFGGNFYLEASTLFRDTHGTDFPAEFIIPNCKIQSNFTFTMASSGDPSTFTFTMDAFPDYTRWNKQEKVFAAIQVIEQGDILEDLERLGTPHNYKSDEDYNPFLTYVREQEKYLLDKNDIPETFNNAIFSSIDENNNIYNDGLGYKKGAFINTGNGQEDLRSSYTVTGFIPYNKDQNIQISGFTSSDSLQGISFYDNNKEFLISKVYTGSNTINSIYNPQEDTTLSVIQKTRMQYIRVCFKNTKLSEMSVVVKDAETGETVPTRGRKNSDYDIIYPDFENLEEEEEPEIESDER